MSERSAIEWLGRSNTPTAEICAVVLGLAYVLLAFGLLAANAVRKAERNLDEAERIARGYGVTSP